MEQWNIHKMWEKSKNERNKGIYDKNNYSTNQSDQYKFIQIQTFKKKLFEYRFFDVLLSFEWAFFMFEYVRKF